MKLLTAILDLIFYSFLRPFVLLVRDVLDLVFLDTLSFFQIPPTGQVIFIAFFTTFLTFVLRKRLKVEEKNKRFRKEFNTQKQKRDNISIVDDRKIRDAMYESADQSIDEDFNTYLVQHYVQYVLVYLLPIFLVMAWLNNSLDERLLPAVSGHSYLFILSSQPFGMTGISVTLLFLLSYLLFLILGFWYKKRFAARV